MNIELVKDLIKSRIDGLFSDLQFISGMMAFTVYPDYQINYLEDSMAQELFSYCTSAKVQIPANTVDANKIIKIQNIIKNKYSLGVSVGLELDSDIYQIEILDSFNKS